MVRKFLKILIYQVAKLLSYLPLKYIVFESLPDYADNTREVFDEMIRRGINKRYKFVWLCSKPDTIIPVDSIILAHQRYKQLYYMMRSKCAISCNIFTYSFGDYQKSIYLCHGVTIKSLCGYKSPGGIDFAVGLSEETNEIQAKEMNLELNRFKTLGYPRNDALNRKSRTDIMRLFGRNYNKIVAWYPTFRQHGSSSIPSATTHSLPIIHNIECAKAINQCAKENDILIVLKPHFSQDTRFIKDLCLDNIVLINDNFYNENHLTSYEFVGGCDSLITDYSSIYFDFLLCNKPIAAIWEDIEEYRVNRGFAIDVDYYMKGAYKIYSYLDFISFLQELSNGTDSMQFERNQIIDIIHKNKDFNSTKRVVDFIENELL